MKNLKFLIIALVAMFGFISCDKDDCNHYDHSADLVGTWTCLQEGFAEALVISADGSMVATGLADGKYWDNVKGNITVKDGKATLAFEDNVKVEGHFDFVPGVAFSINTKEGERMVFNYCKEDLSDEILGMWVSTDNSSIEEHSVLVQTFNENGKSVYTGFGEIDGEIVVKKESNYKVVGDLCFQEVNGKYIVFRVSYSRNGTSLGDIMSMINGGFTSTWLRIKQELNLTNKLYAYSSAYVSNAKGADEDFNILGHNFNMANIANGNFDMLFRSELFCVIFPNANTIKQIYRSNGQDVTIDIPISVEGNKVTLDMSASIPVLRKVDMYMFQDADDTQLHMYMPTQSFINYFANLEVVTMMVEGKIDPTDAAAVAKVYADMEARVESINVSFVMKAIEEIK